MTALLANQWLLKGASSLAVLAGVFFFSGDMPFEGAPRPAQTAQATPPPAPPVQVQALAPAPAAQPILASANGFSVLGVLAPDRPMGAGDYAWEDDGVPPGELTIVGRPRLAAALRLSRRCRDRPCRDPLRRRRQADADRHLQDPPEEEGSHLEPVRRADAVHAALTNDGIAIHGSEVEDGYATHGCIGVPDEFAALLFQEARIGTRVLITKEWMRPVYQALDAPANEA
jgi:hypothetical protein